MKSSLKSKSVAPLPPIAPVLVSVSELRPYEHNARTHSDKQIVQIAASMREFGFIGSILADPHGGVIAGHGRLEAAKSLGMREVPVTYASHLSPAQIRAYRIADNRLAELSGWSDEMLRIEFEELSAMELDFSIEITGFDAVEIDLLMDPPIDVKAQQGPAEELSELEQIAVTRAGDIWLLGHHRLLCGSALDAEAIDRLMDGAEVAMAFTDAPYNVPVSGHVCGLGKVQHREFAMASGEMNEAQFTAFLSAGLCQLQRHARDGAILFACMDWRHASEILQAAKANSLALLNLVVWDKTNGGMGSLYRSKHELVFVFKKGSAPHTNNVQLGKFGRYRTNVWTHAGVNAFGRNRMEELESHPTVKPVALVAEAIRDVSNRGDIVLDLFMGSGTTILAAEQTGRICYGTEIDPLYVDLAIRRWEKRTGQQARLESTGETFAELSASRTAEPEEPAAAV